MDYDSLGFYGVLAEWPNTYLESSRKEYDALTTERKRRITQLREANP